MFNPSEITNWISERFPKNNNWLSGNCYFFAKILEAAWPHGEIVYDPIHGHFLYDIDGILYDWRGQVGERKNEISWNSYRTQDPTHWAHVMRDCVGGEFNI